MTTTKRTPKVKVDSASILSQLAGNAPVVATKVKKTGRPELVLPEATEQQFRSYIPVKALADVVVAREKVLKGDLNNELMQLHVANFWRLRTLPANPALKGSNSDGTPDCEGLFVIQSRFMIEIPELQDGQTPQNALVGLFVNLGLDEEKATELVENELDFTPDISVRLNELLNGRKTDGQWQDATDAEKQLGKKISGWLMGQETDPLTPAEREKALKITAKAVVKDGFLQRVCTYCSSEEDLSNVFKVIRPVVQNRGAKFGISDTPTRRTDRLLEVCKDILGTSSNVEGDED